jgi:subtilisin-like proprotein convertase family protein
MRVRMVGSARISTLCSRIHGEWIVMNRFCRRVRVALPFALALFVPLASAADFAGGNVGPIPDNNPAGRDVAFAVAGMTAPLADVSVSITLTHAYVRDLQVELIAPSGAARRMVVGRVGYGASGGSSDFAGTYRFGDRFQSDFWLATATANGAPIVPGSYRASTAGSSNNIKTGGCTMSLTYAFEQLEPAQINGIWTLHVADLESPDTGTITAAKLTLLGTNDALFGSGFDEDLRGSCVRAQFDYTGSNRTSYVVVRNTGGGPGGAITWYIRDNDGTANGFERSVEFGTSSDNFVGGDFDGDGIWDPAVWTPGVPGHYKVLRSSRPGAAPLELDYGQTGDDPEQAGDYDGDGKADFALYRAGAADELPSFTLIRLSSTGADRILQTGLNGYFASGGLDITGDGLADVGTQHHPDGGGGVAEINIHTGTTGAVVDTFDFGTPTDLIVGGSHVGNARADVTVVRGSGGNIVWTVRDSATGTATTPVNFGVSATDFVLSGDFDGDGIDDFSVWRPNADPAQTKFHVRPSSDPGAPFEVNFGQNGDYPVANTRSH